MKKIQLKFTKSKKAIVLCFLIYVPFSFGQNNLQEIPQVVVEPLLENQSLPVYEKKILSIPDIGPNKTVNNADIKIDVKKFSLVFDDKNLISDEIKNSSQTYVDNFLESSGSTLSFFELDEIVFSLTEFLRAQGFILAQALLPAQEVRSGVVLIRVLPGELSEILVSNNKLFSAQNLTYPFESGLGKVVERDFIESNTLRLNDLPGLSSTAVFKAGENIGETALTVQVIDERKVDTAIQFDNFGSESSGITRAIVSGSFNNLFKRFDTLTLDLFKTFDFDIGGVENGRINYEVVHPSLIHSFGLDYSDNNFITKSDLQFFGIDSDTQRGSVYLRSQWIRSLDQNFSTTFNLSVKKASIYSSLSPLYGGEDKLTVAMLEFDYDAIDSRFDAVHRIKFAISQGFDDLLGSMDKNGDGGSLTKVNGQSNLSSEFLKYNISYTRLQTLNQDYSLFWHNSLQYSDDWLSTMEKVSLGGPYSVRAYPSQEYIRDSVFFSSLALQTNMTTFLDYFSFDGNILTDAMNLSLFFDYGIGKSPNNLSGDDAKVEISGWGLELKLESLKPNLDTSITFAAPFKGNKAINGDSSQLWLSLGINF